MKYESESKKGNSSGARHMKEGNTFIRTQGRQSSQRTLGQPRNTKQGVRKFVIKSPSEICDTKKEKAVFILMHRGVSQ